MKTEPKLIKVTLEYDNGHKLVRTKDDVLPFLIRLAKQLTFKDNKHKKL
jgi:hypothetical protein